MQRMLKFGSKANLVNTEVRMLIEHIHQLLRQEAFDDSVLGNLIDSDTIPQSHHDSLSIDWDVAIIVEALEELYPLQAEHKHLDFGSRWQQVVDKSVSRVRVSPVRSDGAST